MPQVDLTKIAMGYVRPNRSVRRLTSLLCMIWYNINRLLSTILSVRTWDSCSAALSCDEDSWFLVEGPMRMLRLMIFLVLVGSLAVLAPANAGYVLNGNGSVIGAYAYDVPPSVTMFGDLGQQFLPFASGALTDGNGDNLGQSIGYSTLGDGSYYRWIFVDLGQEVVLSSLAAKSSLAAWWHLGMIEADFSLDGASFSNKAKAYGDYLALPHAEGLGFTVDIPVVGRHARFMRIRVNVPAWYSVQIGELCIVADTPQGVPPIGSMTMDALQTLVQNQTQTPRVNAYGQWTRDEWAGKVHTDSEMVQAIAAEDSRYAGVAVDSSRLDQYGGDKTLGIRSAATGAWRLQKLNGRWWFITPEGYPFIMKGVAGLGLGVGNYNTVEYPGKPELAGYFAWLPPKTGTYAPCWTSVSVDGGTAWRFDFLRANMIKAFSSVGYEQRFENLLARRLIDWGFNCRAKWSGPGFAANRLPYILTVSPMPDAGVSLVRYGELADPWDANFAKSVENTVTWMRDNYGADSYFIGFHLGSEDWWSSDTTQAVLASIPATPAKKAFVSYLNNAYGTIASLNAKCGTSWTSFASLHNIDLTPYTTVLAGDISSFIEQASRRYYSAWRSAVDDIDTGRLFLGASFVMWWKCCPEWVRGSATYCDAMALDCYPLDAEVILNGYVDEFAVPANRPVLVAEYGVTTTDRGYLQYPTMVLGQTDRGLAYRDLNKSLFAHPNWVGCSWFQYNDQVLVGRDINAGGESCNFGLVDMANLPYYEMVDIVKETNKSLYGIHAGAYANSWDVERDFPSIVNPYGAWSLGWMDSASPGSAFHPFGKRALDSGNVLTWSDSGSPTEGVEKVFWDLPSIVAGESTDGVGLHPSTIPASVRWIAPSAGSYAITAEFSDLSGGITNAGAQVWVKGQSAFNSQVRLGNSVYWSSLVVLAQGQAVDFLVDKGADGDCQSDRVGLQATVTRIGDGWSVADSFSPDANPNGPWVYGRVSSLTPGATLYPLNSTKTTSSGLKTWYGSDSPAGDYPNVTFNQSATPLNNGKYPAYGVALSPSWENGVIRWTASSGGTYLLKALFNDYSLWQNNSTNVCVCVGFAPVFSGSVYYGGSASCSLVRQLSAGQTIEFAVDQHLNSYFTDLTGIDASITPVPDSCLVALKDARLLEDGRLVRIVDGIVSAAFEDSIYLESEHREAGIRVDLNGHVLQVGMGVDTLGVLRTNSSGERCVAALYAVQNGYGEIGPLGMDVSRLGGISRNYDPSTGAGQAPVGGAAGLSNVGLLVRVWGTLTRTGNRWALSGSAGDAVVMEVPSGVTMPDEGEFVVVTGISSCEKGLGTNRLCPLLRLRGPVDIQAVL